jgi:hypothetical protein
MSKCLFFFVLLICLSYLVGLSVCLISTIVLYVYLSNEPDWLLSLPILTTWLTHFFVLSVVSINQSYLYFFWSVHLTVRSV